MDDFNKILAITEDSRVELAASFKELLHKELTLGMTNYVCKYGTLSDGHDKITDSQRYYQAIREMYNRANEIANQKVISMTAQADLIDAEEELDKAETKSQKLRAEAKILQAKNALRNSLVYGEDTLRQLNAFNEVRLELQDKVRAQYPEGIEQAEPDNWRALTEYKIARQKAGHIEMLQHMPMPSEEKAKLGVQSGIPELYFWEAVNNKDEIMNKFGGDMRKYIQHKEQLKLENK